jgi:Holliday junction resolvasome RuvABC endonuclease subunit
MIVLAIDPSTTSTGWCIYNTELDYAEDYGTIQPKVKDPIKRIMVIRNEIKELMRVWKPELVVIEDLSVTRNAKTTKILAGLQVELEILCVHYNMLYYLVRPAEWRKVVGIKGRDRKTQKKNAIEYVKRRELADKVNEDEADALCIGAFSCSLEVE